MPFFHAITKRVQQFNAKQWVGIMASILVGLYSFAIIRHQSMMINGRFAFWLHDDMMISMRYARNLAQGAGLVWNAGEAPVEGYSNLVWVLIMAVVHLFPLPNTITSLILLLLNIIIAILILHLTTRLYQQWHPQPNSILFCILLALTLSIDLFRWTIIGLETPLQTAVFLWLLLRVLQEAAQAAPQAKTFFFAGFLGLIRVDGFILGGLLCLLALSLHQDKRRVLRYSPLILLLPLLHVGVRLIYYGQPLPNTYYLKVTAWDTRWQSGLNYIGRFLVRYGWAWLLAGWGVWRSQDARARTLWVISLPLLAYTLYVGGDDFGGLRFMAPWLPVLIVLTFLAPHWLPTRWLKSPLLLLLLFSLTTGFNFLKPGPTAEAPFLQTGLALNDLLLPKTTIGHYWAGTTPYFSQRTAIDLLGKNDAILARTPAYAGSNKPGHNKFDYDHSLGQQQPDLIVAPITPAAIIDPATLDRLTTGDDAYAGQFYRHPHFQKNYAANLIFINEVALFIHQESPEHPRLMVGNCQPITRTELQTLGLRQACWPLSQ